MSGIRDVFRPGLADIEMYTVLRENTLDDGVGEEVPLASSQLPALQDADTICSDCSSPMT